MAAMNLELNHARLHPRRRTSKLVGNRARPFLKFNFGQSLNAPRAQVGHAAALIDLKMIADKSGHGIPRLSLTEAGTPIVLITHKVVRPL